MLRASHLGLPSAMDQWPWDPLGPSWGYLGLAWAILGPSWGQPGDHNASGHFPKSLLTRCLQPLWAEHGPPSGPKRLHSEPSVAPKGCEKMAASTVSQTWPHELSETKCLQPCWPPDVSKISLRRNVCNHCGPIMAASGSTAELTWHRGYTSCFAPC